MIRTEDGNIFTCVAFDDWARKVKGVAVNIAVTVKGYFRSPEDKEAGHVTCNALALPEEKLSAKDKIILEYGSIEKYRDYVRETIEQKLKDGYVRVQRKDTQEFLWRKREDCVKLETGWIEKTEFLSEVFTPPVFEAKIKAGLAEGKPWKEISNSLLGEAYKLWAGCEYPGDEPRGNPEDKREKRAPGHNGRCS